MWPDGFPTGDYVRQVRRRLEVSQRQMAVVSGVSRTTLARVEAGGGAVPVETLERLLSPAGWVLVVVEKPAGEEADRIFFVPPLREWGGSCRDGAGRRYPAHLPLVVDPLPGEWWAPFGLIRPPE
ncbi:MAG: helix-turn-helix domain-containing protein, partial [Kineosporiaceae bacterium]